MMGNNLVKRALNNTLSGLSVSQGDARELLAQAKGGKKVKRKISVALVFALVIVTLAVTALAVITIREVGQLVAQNEKEKGLFVNWTSEQKTKLISSLVELKYIESNDEVSSLIKGNLSEQEARTAANDVIAKYTGQDINDINFLSIMQVPMGPVEKWTYEEKAWYSQLMRDVGIEGDGITFFVKPIGKLSEQDAIAIAKKEVAMGYGVSESELDRYKISVSFEIPEANEPEDKQAYWHVDFSAPSGMTEDERLFIFLPVYVHPETGSLLWSVKDMLSLKDANNRPLNAVYKAIKNIEMEANYEPFRNWPLELKAKYSMIVAPLVQKIVKSGDLSSLTLNGVLDIETLARSSYSYGLPKENDIPQAMAFESAKAVVHDKFDVKNEVFNLYLDNIVYYDISNEEKPLWKFLFNAGSLDWRTLNDGLNNPLTKQSYKVEIDAHNGTIENAEQFDFERHGESMESEMKWY